MAKAPDHKPREDHDTAAPTPAVADLDVAAVPLSQPGPDEAPPTTPERRGETPDPAVFEFPEPRKLTKGQITGLCAEGLEAYMFGQRTRYDANGRLWNMRREAVNDLWQLTITVSLQGVLLGQGGLPLDRLPSAEGEHQLIELIEGMAGGVERAHRDIYAEQQKLLHGREREHRDDREDATAAKPAEREDRRA